MTFFTKTLHKGFFVLSNYAILHLQKYEKTETPYAFILSFQINKISVLKKKISKIWLKINTVNLFRIEEFVRVTPDGPHWFRVLLLILYVSAFMLSIIHHTAVLLLWSSTWSWYFTSWRKIMKQLFFLILRLLKFSQKTATRLELWEI